VVRRTFPQLHDVKTLFANCWKTFWASMSSIKMKETTLLSFCGKDTFHVNNQDNIVQVENKVISCKEAFYVLILICQ
jgi:hypothetical protein